MSFSDPSSLILLLIGLIIVVAISYFFFRWVFSMKRQLWNQKAQINVLLKIADKLGVPSDEVDIIREKNNKSSDSNL